MKFKIILKNSSKRNERLIVLQRTRLVEERYATIKKENVVSALFLIIALRFLILITGCVSEEVTNIKEK